MCFLQRFLVLVGTVKKTSQKEEGKSAMNGQIEKAVL
jgi:hypothetical protein